MGFVLTFLFVCSAPALSFPVRFTDSAGTPVVINQKPGRAVSLVPSVSEIIFDIGAADSLKGITYHDTFPYHIKDKKVVGGFFSPSLEAIKDLKPDIIFYSGLHGNIYDHFRNENCLMVNLDTRSIADAKRFIELLGKIFNREQEALKTVKKIEKELEHVSNKISRIPAENRKRVVRLMGRNRLMTPGDDSFQNEMIAAAGGIPPKFGKKGSIVEITKEDWMRFNPQVIYGCGGDRETAAQFFSQNGFKDVEAVRNGRIHYFPCELTCRASTHTGYFVTWLASVIYGDEFSKKKNQVRDNKIFKTYPIVIDLPYIRSARINHSHLYDFTNKTLVVDFKKPLTVLSTLEGFRKKIRTVGNHYTPPPSWGLNHKHDLESIMRPIYRVNGKSSKHSAFLLTGADMDKLSIQKKTFKAMKVWALVTAGVTSNALRMSKDTGLYYEPGTINMIILTNMSLSQRAMSRAIISATEGKTAALLDMDIRSSANPRFYRATGTGTDNIIVVQGDGGKIDHTGGHTRMGELIAKAVYAGVQDAVLKQNSLFTGRNVFQRLKERKISIYGLVSDGPCDCGLNKSERVALIEQTLLIPKYADFIEASFAVSDDVEKGLIRDLSFFRETCHRMAEDIAGKKITILENHVDSDQIPEVIRMALNSVINGIHKRY